MGEDINSGSNARNMPEPQSLDKPQEAPRQMLVGVIKQR
jgi:hypothetical protein